MSKNHKQFNTVLCLAIVCAFGTQYSSFAAASGAEATAPLKTPEQEKYETCTALVKNNPPEALRMAGEWATLYPSYSSRHCLALSYFSNQHFAESEKELRQIAATLPTGNAGPAASLLMQAADAAAADNRLKDGVSDLTDAMMMASANSDSAAMRDVVSKRSKLNLELGRLQAALQDIEHAMTLSDNKSDLFVTRARIYMALGMDDEAGKDLKMALEKAPANAEATPMLASLQKKTKSD